MITSTITKMITPPRLAEQFGVSVQKILGWIASGDLRAVNVATHITGRPRWAIDAEEVERFKRARASTPTSPKAQRLPRRC